MMLVALGVIGVGGNIYYQNKVQATSEKSAESHLEEQKQKAQEYKKELAIQGLMKDLYMTI